MADLEEPNKKDEKLSDLNPPRHIEIEIKNPDVLTIDDFEDILRQGRAFQRAYEDEKLHPDRVLKMYTQFMRMKRLCG